MCVCVCVCACVWVGAATIRERSCRTKGQPTTAAAPSPSPRLSSLALAASLLRCGSHVAQSDRANENAATALTHSLLPHKTHSLSFSHVVGFSAEPFYFGVRGRRFRCYVCTYSGCVCVHKQPHSRSRSLSFLLMDRHLSLSPFSPSLPLYLFLPRVSPRALVATRCRSVRGQPALKQRTPGVPAAASESARS